MRKQILVVEDNELNRAILCEILSGEYQVLEAGNGQEALDVLRQHKDSIALILLDVMMPVMDGYTFLDRVRDDAELSLIPVIVTTQSDGEEDEVSALAHGATDFVPKPYRPQVILHRVASLIKLRETAAMVNQFQYDRLTGLYSKGFFYQKVRERLDTDTEREFTIVCSDIENFKLYNDTFGREAGDRLLRETACCGRPPAAGDRLLRETACCGRALRSYRAWSVRMISAADTVRTASFACGSGKGNGRIVKYFLVNLMPSVPREWRIYPLNGASMRSRTAPFLWSRCATGRCWRQTASRDSTISPSLSMMTRSAASCCGRKPSPTLWRPPWMRNNL